MSNSEVDFPNVRASRLCPLYRGHKDASLVACWPCYRARGLRGGDAGAESLIERAEAELRQACAPARP